MGTPTDTERLLIRATAPGPGGEVVDVVPANAPWPGWTWTGIVIVELAGGQKWERDLDGVEAHILPLAGGCSVQVVHDGEERAISLTGRACVFDGPSDSVYLPLGSSVTVHADRGPVRFAVSTARASRRFPLRVLTAADARVDLRGTGNCSRQVSNYTLNTDVEVDHLLVCEVITPGGNWSSYPPHKHDEHSENERELEEIYYYEVAAGPHGPGFAYHRNYGTADRPLDVFAQVRTGDVALVPHGFHGPCMAAPGYDLYYLNVMAGPATDGRWLSVDDPAVTWVRETWNDHEVDPRLPVVPGRTPAPRIPASATTPVTEVHR